ncbi:metallo-mystery pair system four-Cys motif protein [Oscillatoriales cyanobacterium USR001]|nr:metallo-mystery pair system four-Cys motif protein [Oscillatoriales cyanobacterium USR001]
MKKHLLRSTIAISLTIPGSYLAFTWNQAQAQETQEVEIKFSAAVGNQPFNCGKSYANLGKPESTVTPTDFRFYVSDLALIDGSGKTVPISLKQDGKWQYQNVALLDFENKVGACSNGTVEMRDRVVGTIPKGNYKGLQFILGVPFNLNHSDAALAPSPLNLTSLWWNWRGGYKFLRIDLKNQSASHANTSEKEHGQHGHGGNQTGFSIHLGSTGCQASGDNQKPNNCSNPNAAKVIFSNFDTQKNTVVADLKALVANSNLESNQPNTPLGCMSAPNDGDCEGIMTNLGLPFGGQSPVKQTFFTVK